MATESAPITHVMDTAFWVAQYRAEESERSDALFRDPLAKVLLGKTGGQFAQKKFAEKYTRWTIIIRTVIIDNYIKEAIAGGADTILNLGAGLDTRPYRMDLPAHIKWIEVDYEKTISYKNPILAGEKPRCELERIILDLADRTARKNLFMRINAEGKKILVLTEGVVPYLDEAHVTELGQDLRDQSHFYGWIAEYISPQVYPYFNSPKRKKLLENAPFKFMPADWFGVFKNAGWRMRENKYLPEVGAKLGRPFPMPLIITLLLKIAPKSKQQESQRMTGFVLFEKA